MNNLNDYIRESIFSNDVEKKIHDTRQELILAELKKYSYDNLGSYDKKFSAWDHGKVEIGPKDDIRVTGHLVLKNLPKNPNFKISYVWGSVTTAYCDITSLEGVFTPDCQITGALMIYDNKNLVSLKGSPWKVGQFFCHDNPKLKFAEYKNGPEEVTQGVYTWKNNQFILGNTEVRYRDELKKNIRGLKGETHVTVV